jgi:CelD/BcsL family acetyltransferase involved in cellulose biosynthesis
VKPFTIVEHADYDTWNQFVYEHPKGSIFHTPYMVEVFNATRQHEPLALLAIDATGEILALLVAVRVQTLPDPLGSISSRSIWYAEPICRDDDQGLEALIALIEAHDTRMRGQVLFTEIRPIWGSGVERAALEQCGYTYMEYLNFVADLSQPVDQLWNNMAKSCRADIRRSKKRGLQVEEVTSQESVDLLYHFCSMSYEHSKVPLADKSLFTAALNILQPHNMLSIFVAYHEDTPIAADVMLTYKQMVFAWYGGLERVKTVFPVECLTWHEIEWGSQNGYTHYDFGGAGWPDEPYGVRDFKAKFRGELVNYGRYRKVFAPRKLALATRAYELRQSLLDLSTTKQRASVPSTSGS